MTWVDCASRLGLVVCAPTGSAREPAEPRGAPGVGERHPDTPETFFTRTRGRFEAVLADPVSPMREAVVRGMLDDIVDFDEVARRAFGKPCPPAASSCKNHWDELTPDQRTEVTGLVRLLVQEQRRKHLSKALDYESSYRETRAYGETLSKVKTQAKSKRRPSEPAVQIDYMVVRDADGYRLVDVVAEGSSMTKNYYDQFHRMLSTPGQGYALVVTKLNAKITSR